MGMFFTPNLKRKRGGNSKCLIKPFPSIEFGQKYNGIFTGISVEVCACEDIVAIYDSGFYGKGSQSRSTPQIVIHAGNPSKLQGEIAESLCLGLEEAFFLAYYLNVLKINDYQAIEMQFQRFLQDCLKVSANFTETLAAYLYLKSKGWVVKSGLKFGGNFLIYHKGPRFYHASFVVIISTPSKETHLDSKNFKGLQRIAETSDKDILLLEVNTPSDFHFLHLDAISNIEISETVIRRFNCTSYVQNKNTTK